MKSSNSSDDFGDLIQVGRIIGAHGIAGVVKVYSYAESAECFAPRKQLVLIDGDRAVRSYAILRSQAYKSVMRLTLDGVTTRNQAEELTGSDAFIAKKDLPPLEPDTYYWSDLLGMAVYTVAGEYLGRIEQIIPTGANDVYAVKTPEGVAAGEILIPAIESVVLDIDLEMRRMRVELPEGLV